MSRKRILVLVAGAVAAGAVLAQPSHNHAMHEQHAGPSGMADTRTLVRFPEELRTHMLANMRDHLLALQEILSALAGRDYDQAAAVAEQRLGMTSLSLHGAHAVAPYMPEAMRAIGSRMHQAASRFAVEAGNAGASDDVAPALAALAQVTEQCVACHFSYRVQ